MILRFMILTLQQQRFPTYIYSVCIHVTKLYLKASSGARKRKIRQRHKSVRGFVRDCQVNQSTKQLFE